MPVKMVLVNGVPLFDVSTEKQESNEVCCNCFEEAEILEYGRCGECMQQFIEEFGDGTIENEG